MQEAALASERLGEFHLTIMQDKEEAGYRFKEAVKYWGDWGAKAKVRHLQKKYSSLMAAKPSQIFAVPLPRGSLEAISEHLDL